MNIVFYADEYLQLFSLPFGEMLYRIFFWYFGWLPVAIAFLFAAGFIWLEYRAGKWAATQKYVLLAVDVPKVNEQGPVDIEHMFTYLMGIQSSPNFIETWWEGKFQMGYSLEIVGIDGYIQFLMRGPANARPNMEAAIYSQYPDAEVTEVSDYTIGTPSSFPDPEYDIWGADFVPVESEFFPIRTHTEKDTMATLMELLSSLRPGEQFWFQLLVLPVDASWTKAADKFIAKLIGPMVEGKMQNLTPIEKKKIEMASEKKNKIGFKCKIRAIYFAKRKVMDKTKVINGFVGYMRQFSENNLNGFMPAKITVTSTAYFSAASRLAARKNAVMANYKGRSLGRGATPYILNTEELATLWHFPSDKVVKAPLLQRAASKRMEAPSTLPMHETAPIELADNIFEHGVSLEPEVAKKTDKPKADFGQFLAQEILSEAGVEEKVEDKPPENLPFV